MAKAIWNDAVIAESDTFETVEGNVYFPLSALKMEHFQPSKQTSVCFWKGRAHYYDVVVNGEINRNAAWYYPQPSPLAKKIAGYVAFWRGVKVKK
ncbi:MAG: DUF427 domain-containing protein [Thiobacillus sp.]|nr:DUF427 domain-containing protein [Thiobacillus sp.]